MTNCTKPLQTRLPDDAVWIVGSLWPAPSVQCHKVWLTPTTTVRCSDAAKTQNPLKFEGVFQTSGLLSAASGLKFAMLLGHVEDILLFN